MTQTRFHDEVAEIWYGALSGRGLGAARRLFDDGSLLHMPGESGLAGRYQGGEAILSLMELTARLTKGTLEYRPLRVFSGDARTIIWGRLSAARQGLTLETDTVHLLSFEGATVREIVVFHEDQDLVDRFWTEHG